MKDLFSIRMRASKTVRSVHYGVSSRNEEHISGAEGLYRKSEMQKTVKKYIKRALKHPRGKADKIVITIEDIKQRPIKIPTLPLATIRCGITSGGEKIAKEILKSIGISKKATGMALRLIKKGSMRGAALITSKSGNRLEHDKKRGIRVSRLGINKSASRKLSSRLAKFGINTDTVKEALILASKVTFSKQVIAELCVSDDPHYTTGYVASKKLGYLRIPHIKSQGSRIGGRAFFVNERANIKEIITYIERTPVIVTKITPCRGIISIDEILDCSHK